MRRHGVVVMWFAPAFSIAGVAIILSQEQPYIWVVAFCAAGMGWCFGLAFAMQQFEE